MFGVDRFRHWAQLSDRVLEYKRVETISSCWCNMDLQLRHEFLSLGLVGSDAISLFRSLAGARLPNSAVAKTGMVDSVVFLACWTG